MSQPIHPAAIHHLPAFITAPGESDPLFAGMAIFLLAAVLGIGIFYFKLHALPEQMAHRGQKMQFELVAVLGLISLFTHNHAFWIAGLLLAIVPLPDFTTPLTTIAGSLQRLADASGAPPAAPPPAAKPSAHAGPAPADPPPPPPARDAPPASTAHQGG